MKQHNFAFIFITSTIYALYSVTPEKTVTTPQVQAKVSAHKSALKAPKAQKLALASSALPASPQAVPGEQQYETFCRTEPLPVSCVPEA
jgi:hypothetical protein